MRIPEMHKLSRAVMLEICTAARPNGNDDDMTDCTRQHDTDADASERQTRAIREEQKTRKQSRLQVALLAWNYRFFQLCPMA